MAEITEKGFRDYGGQQKVEFIRGKFRNFNAFCEESLLEAMKESRPDFTTGVNKFKKIFSAFVLEVEDCISLNFNMDGTSLNKVSSNSIITLVEFKLLKAKAAHLAAVIFDKQKFLKSAAESHVVASRRLAMAKATLELLERHLEV